MSEGHYPPEATPIVINCFLFTCTTKAVDDECTDDCIDIFGLLLLFHHTKDNLKFRMLWRS